MEMQIQIEIKILVFTGWDLSYFSGFTEKCVILHHQLAWNYTKLFFSQFQVNWCNICGTKHDRPLREARTRTHPTTIKYTEILDRIPCANADARMAATKRAISPTQRSIMNLLSFIDMLLIKCMLFCYSWHRTCNNFCRNYEKDNKYKGNPSNQNIL